MTKEFKCYIVGAGGHGRVVLSILQAGRQYNAVHPLGFLSDLTEEWGRMIDGYPVCGGTELLWAKQGDNIYGIIAIGDNHKRAKSFNEVATHGVKFIKAIHPSSIVDPRTTIDDGVMICPGVIVNTGAHISSNSIINSGAIIEHDCKIGEHVHIAPGTILTGNVTIGTRSFIGAGTTVLPGIVVGTDVIVGAGSVVTKNIPDGTVVAGIPAKPLKQQEA